MVPPTPKDGFTQADVGQDRQRRFWFLSGGILKDMKKRDSGKPDESEDYYLSSESIEEIGVT